jgi:hypothetical protein
MNGKDRGSGNVVMTLEVTSDVLGRAGGCKSDLVAIGMNERSLISRSSGGVDVCKAPKLMKPSGYAQWGYFKGRAVWSGSASSPNSYCPYGLTKVVKGKRYDFYFRLKDSGDGKALTTLYIGMHSVSSFFYDNKCD